ncbi:glucose 1-dehydrogenase [Micromonospora sp. WMMD1102]|uniref:SDR family NAD(P)-dependent oxidoreductase n=1 Tax=Micromonospora sp. WMMD1102 TaxID=3016105 RepID=UPI002414FBEA|nr:glucose 1-dehydrogenase [Micromonospora sp. WMMD1102]MDG4791733.1 glucose 1-dehydrogenase [Micromonospora sp. WMMD1102]
MTGVLHGRSALVTGASRGIGRGIALGLAAAGADVAVNYHVPARPEFGRDNAGDATAVTDEIAALGRRALAIEADVSDGVAVQRMVDQVVTEFGRLDILVNSAGICPFHDFLTMPEALWDRVHEVNLKGAFLCSQAAARAMAAAGRGGRIIGISSISALVGGGQQAHYTPTKAGMHSLMQSMAIALGPHGITCNSIMPGAIATDINRDDWSDPDKRAYLDQRIPLGRFGEPDDIAGPAVFLASDAARYVTGASLLVDGGLFVNLQ